ncbi:MAG: hypothetical protein Q9175_006561 [Cornicularia normoerica]
MAALIALYELSTTYANVVPLSALIGKSDRTVDALDGFKPLLKLATKSISDWYVKSRFNYGVLLKEDSYNTSAAFVFNDFYGGSHLSAGAFHLPTYVEM